MARKILVVEDDVLIAELERDYLEASGYACEVATSGEAGLALALSGGFDLVLLDVMLPGLDGFDICRRIRAASSVPVVLVTAKDGDVDKVRGLGLGADDYVTKPFSPAELVARVAAHIRVHDMLAGDGAGAGAIVSGDLAIYPDERRVTVGGADVELRSREFDLLLLLARNPGVVFAKEQVFERVWGMDAVGDLSTVAVHVNRIRAKIERDPANPDHLQTVRGAGYRFARD